MSVKRLLWTTSVLALATVGTLAQVKAEGLPARNSWISNYEPVTLDFKTHNFYGGLSGNYAWIEEKYGTEETWAASGFLGYLWRNERVGLGVEADYTVWDLENFDLDDGTVSLRGRAGVFLSNRTFLYGTAGIARTYAAPVGMDRGLVVGGGIDVDVTKNAFLRAEVLHYRLADEYVSWGEDGVTAVRMGFGLKF